MGGQLTAAVHIVVAPHVLCAEHGELIEIGLARADVARAPSDAGSLIADATTERGHDHCALAALGRSGVALGRGPMHEAPVAHDKTNTPAISIDSQSPAIAILRLAPKNSPPA